MQLWTVNKTSDPPRWKKEPFNPFGEKDVPGAFPNAGKPLLSLFYREDREETKWVVFDRKEETALEQVGSLFFGGAPAYALVRAITESSCGVFGDVVYLNDFGCEQYRYRPMTTSGIDSSFLAIRLTP